ELETLFDLSPAAACECARHLNGSSTADLYEAFRIPGTEEQLKEKLIAALLRVHPELADLRDHYDREKIMKERIAPLLQIGFSQEEVVAFLGEDHTCLTMSQNRYRKFFAGISTIKFRFDRFREELSKLSPLQQPAVWITPEHHSRINGELRKREDQEVKTLRYGENGRIDRCLKRIPALYTSPSPIERGRPLISHPLYAGVILLALRFNQDNPRGSSASSEPKVQKEVQQITQRWMTNFEIGDFVTTLTELQQYGIIEKEGQNLRISAERDQWPRELANFDKIVKKEL
ncbi:hypothetical protein MRY87_02240, partial [bacterium]|nr:hypothetical protein [bacterium]